MADGGFVALIDPQDLRIYRVPAAKADVYRKAGWGEPDYAATPRHDEIKQSLSGWYENGQAAGLTVLRGVPFATYALGKVVDKNTMQALAMKVRIFDEAHPLLSKALEIGGGVATAAAVTSGVGALGGALGLGAEAAGAGVLGSEAAGLGAEAGAGAAEATGVGAAGEAAGVGAEAAGAASEGAGVGAASEAATGAEGAQAAEVAQGAQAGAGEAIGAGEQSTGQLTSGAKQIGDGVRSPEIEAPTGLARTDQLERFTKGLNPEITDAEFSELPSGIPDAAAEGEAATGLGAEAGEAGTAGQAATPGADAGFGAETGAGAGEAAGAPGVDPTKFNLFDYLTKSKLVKTAAIGAAENTVFGAAYRIDAQALEHALSPEGQEKLTFGANDLLLDAAIGAVTPLGLSALGKGIGKAGSKITDQSLSMLRKALLKDHMVEAAISQGEEGPLYNVINSQMGKSAGQILHNSYIKAKTAFQGLNVIKSKYDGSFLNQEAKERILDSIVEITGTDRDPFYIEVSRKLRKKFVSIGNLQTITKALDKGENIVWDDPKFALNPRNLIGRDVRNVLAKAQRDLIEISGPTGAQDAVQWQRLNQDASIHQRVLSAISGKRGVEVDQILSNIGTSAGVGALLGAFGLAGGGALAAGMRTGGWQAVHHLKIQHVAPLVNKTGKFMLGIDSTIAKAIDAGLGGLPGQLHKTYAHLDYDETAAAVSQAGADPSKTIANLQNSLNQQGIPQEFSTGVAQTQAAGLSHLKASMPKRNDAPDVPTESTGDPVQQHRWLDQVKTFKDPSYGLANPTADNLRILKQFYPQTLFSAQQALYQQIAKNPQLPSEARSWAAKVMERPLNNLDSPTFAQTLRQARAANAPGGNGGGPPASQGGGKSQGAVESSLTRADQLQNR